MGNNGRTVGDGLAALKQVYAQEGAILARAGPFLRTSCCIRENPPATGAGDVGSDAETVGDGLAALK
jgi:hypothetical protein